MLQTIIALDLTLQMPAIVSDVPRTEINSYSFEQLLSILDLTDLHIAS